MVFWGGSVIFIHLFVYLLEQSSGESSCFATTIAPVTSKGDTSHLLIQLPANVIFEILFLLIGI